MSSSSGSSNRHPKAQLSVSEITLGLFELKRDALLQIAISAIQSPNISNKTLKLANKLVSEGKSCMLHCVRCHEDYDPMYTSYNHCVMDDHDEGNGLIRMGKGPFGLDQFAWPCCEKMEDEGEGCFEGTHINSWEDGGDYWNDEALAEDYDGDCSKCNPEKESSDEECIDEE